MCCGGVTAANCTSQWRLHGRLSHTIADSRKHFRRFLQRTTVSLASQNALDSVGCRGDHSRRSLLATPARYRKGQPRVGNRYPANEHGLHSASLYYLYGGWSCGLVVAAVTSCRLLVGDTRKRTLLLLCGAIILPSILMSLQGISVDTSAFARYLICSVPFLLILMAQGIHWLARHVRILRRGSRSSLVPHHANCPVLGAQHPIPFFRQETMAIC